MKTQEERRRSMGALQQKLEAVSQRGARSRCSWIQKWCRSGPMRNAARGAALLFLLPAFQGMAPAQDAPAQPPPSPTQVSSLLQPTLRELSSTIAGLRIPKWKAPGPVKDEAQGNAGSIDRDLQNTLPALIAQADATPQSIPSTFAVYRNLDALYEVLLRVSGTAELAAPDEEAANVAHSLLTLDAARKTLADSILSASHAQEAALQQARQQVSPQVAPQVPAPATVVNDGPVVSAAHRKPKPKPKAATPATPQT